MHNSIGIITWENLCLIYHHRLISFPSKSEHFLQLPKRTFYKIEQPLHPLPGDPICTPSSNVWLAKCLIHHVRNFKRIFLKGLLLNQLTLR